VTTTPAYASHGPSDLLNRLSPIKSQSRRIICVGQLSVDTHVNLSQPLKRGDQSVGIFKSVPGGTAAVVAHNSAVLGGDAVFCGHVGVSADDQRAAERLREVGVEFGPTITTNRGLRVIVLVDPEGERTMIAQDVRPAWHQLTLDLVRQGDLVYFEGWPLFDEDVADAYARHVDQARRAGALVALDACSASRAKDPRSFAELIRSLQLDILFANETESVRYRLLRTPPAKVVVIHRGVHPTLVRSSAGVTSVPVVPVPAIDTTGAGDTFAAGYLCALARRPDLLIAAQQANAAARQVVGVRGGLLPFPQDKLLRRAP
jgi:sugar/nucleoside kinase (ribokinase family)